MAKPQGTPNGSGHRASSAAVEFQSGRSSVVSDVAILVFTTVTCGGVILLAFRSNTQDSAGSFPPPALVDQATKSLLRLPRTASVARELLRRGEIDTETLNAAFLRLVRLQAVQPDVLLEAMIVDLSPDASLAERRNLPALVAHQPPGSLVNLTNRLSHLAIFGRTLVTRQVAFAAWSSLDGGLDSAFEHSSADERCLHEFLTALPLVASAVAPHVYDRIESLFRDDGRHSADIQILAVQVMVQLPGQEAEKAETLIRWIRRKRFRSTAIPALAMLPADSWPEERLGELGAGLIAWIAEQPPADRQSPAMTTVYQLCDILELRLPKEKRGRFRRRIDQLQGISPIDAIRSDSAIPDDQRVNGLRKSQDRPTKIPAAVGSNFCCAVGIVI